MDRPAPLAATRRAGDGALWRVALAALVALVLMAAGCLDFPGVPAFDAHADEDGDGLDWDAEQRLGTDPERADSDGDGLLDGREVELHLDPTRSDSDGDGRPDGVEVGEGPAPRDTDGDSVIDALESAFDTDGDGVPEDLAGPGPRGDQDGDGARNGDDNCPGAPNADQEDLDLDGLGDACDSDDDDDQVADDDDSCPRLSNAGPAGQRDSDGDGDGDPCDDDDDDDGVPDLLDSCPTTPSGGPTEQRDSDGDGAGDLCDDDDDGDAVLDGQDNCPAVANPQQRDGDEDGAGDACDEDDDGDEVPDQQDSCPSVPNPDQGDEDGDGTGDACQGAVTVNGGAGYTAETRVQLDLRLVGAQAFRFAVDGGEWSGWVDWADDDGDGHMAYGGGQDEEVLIGGGEQSDDGPKEIAVQTRGAEGLPAASVTYRASIVLDTLAPSAPSVGINAGAEATRTTTGMVTLDLAALDDNGLQWVWLEGVAGPRGADPPAFEAAGRQRFRARLPFTLPSFDADGPKTVWARFEDPAGNLSEPVAAEIRLDTAAPVVLQLGAQAGAGRCFADEQPPCLLASHQVTMLLREGRAPGASGSDIEAVRLSVGDPSFGDAAWVQYPVPPGDELGELELRLPARDGAHTVYLAARDLAGNVVGAAADDRLALQVLVDETPPAAPQLEGPAWVQVPTVELRVANAAPADTLELAWEPAFVAAVRRVSPGAVESVDLPSAEGGSVEERAYELYARYVDAAGNRGPVTTRRVSYDATPPQHPSVRVRQTSPTRADAVELELAVVGATRMRVSADGSCDGGTWEAFAPVKTLPIASDGEHLLSALFADAAGNESGCVSASVVRDTDPPSGGAVRITGPQVLPVDAGPGQARYTRSPQVVLELSAPEDDGVVALRVTNGAALTQELAQPFVQRLAWTLDDGADGDRRVLVELLDAAGNAATVTDAVVLDTHPPGDVSVTVDGGLAYTADRSVSLAVTATDAVTPDTELLVVASNDALFQTTVVLAALDGGGWYEPSWALSEGDGEKSVYVRVADRAGNTTSRLDTIVLDAAATSGAVSVGGQEHLALALVPISFVVEII